MGTLLWHMECFHEFQYGCTNTNEEEYSRYLNEVTTEEVVKQIHGKDKSIQDR